MTKLILTLGGQPIGQFKLDMEHITIVRLRLLGGVYIDLI